MSDSFFDADSDSGRRPLKGSSHWYKKGWWGAVWGESRSQCFASDEELLAEVGSEHLAWAKSEQERGYRAGERSRH